MTSLSSRDLAIVVVTHESAEALPPLLGRLGPDLLPLVLVVDNASTDATVSIARAAGVRTIVNDANLGYGAACNHGAAETDARVLCFLNPDCEPTTELFVKGTAVVTADPTTCAAPALVEDDDHVVAGCQPGYSRLKIAFDVLETNCGGSIWRWMRRLRGFHDLTWSWPHGACWFVSRTGFLDVGGMNPTFFMYMEDVEFGRRWSESGRRTRALDYRLRHRQGHGSRISQSRRRLLLNRSRVDYAAAFHGRLLARVLQAATLPRRIVGLLRPEPR